MLNEAKGDYQDFVDLTVDFGEEILSLLKEKEAREKNRLPYSPDSNVQWT